MPFLDITTAQASFQNYICAFRPQALFPATFTFDNEKRFASLWKTTHIPRKPRNPNPRRIEIRRGGIMIIKAVATLELTQSARSSDEHKGYQNLMAAYSGGSPVVDDQSSNEDSKELAEREKLRRMRISKANKGNTPWNKGRKHSPETLQRIRERTRLAMQDPKVKKKLVNLGHAQSEETKMKIAAGVRMGWERRRGWKMLQETCHFEWQNLVAEASRKGSLGEEELQWDSYKMLDEQLEQEWLVSVEERKNMRRTKGSKRAPKTPEQRRKIAEAITAKWADPTYRNRVYSGLAKYHGSPIGVERKPRRKPSGDGNPKRSPTKKKANGTSNTVTAETKNLTLRSRLKRSNVAPYKDPLAKSKLEMLKNIRAQRAAADTQRSEAILRAKLLIAEAEKAANALEAAATKSHFAQASLIETRKLIAEAISSIESIEEGQANSYENGMCSSLASTNVEEANSDDTDQSSLPNSEDAGDHDSDENCWFFPRTATKLLNHVEEGMSIKVEDPGQTERKVVNGTYTSSENDIQKLGFSNLPLQDILDDNNEILPVNISNFSFLNGNGRIYPSSRDHNSLSSVLDSTIKQTTITNKLDHLEANGSSRHQKNIPKNGAESKSDEGEASSATMVTKKWVCGRLVEVSEGG